MSLNILLWALLLVGAQCMKIGILSDIHFNPAYNPTVNNTCFCIEGCPFTEEVPKIVESDDYAPLGRIYCDPP